MAVFAKKITEVDPEAAIVWAGGIGNATQRKQALDNVLKKWRVHDAPAAEAWGQANGIDLPEL